MMKHPLDPTQPHYGYQPASPADPAVSIITPYYNTGAIFLETVRSLLRQSLQQWEWLIVNDGSDDPAALRVLLPLRSADCRIRVIDQPNQGIAAARNTGAAAARAPFLFFLDSDDLLNPTALETLAWALVSQPQSAFVTSWHVMFGHLNRTWPRGFDTRYAFLHENMVTPLSMVRRSVFEKVGGFQPPQRPEFAGLEDYEFWLRCAANGYWGHDIHEYLAWFRSKPPEAYTSYRWGFRDNPGVLNTFRQVMRARYPQLYRAGLPTVVRPTSWLSNPYTPLDDQPPFENQLAVKPSGRRILLLLYPQTPHGGAEHHAQRLVGGLAARGDHITCCLIGGDVGPEFTDRFRDYTSDTFCLARFVAPPDIPRFLRYLIHSRHIATVLLSQSLLSYQLLPFLQSTCPDTTFVDLLHNEEEGWRHGGYPQMALDYDALLDLHITTSEHVRQWMLARGASPERIAVSPTSIDSDRWQPDPIARSKLRRALGIAEAELVVITVGRLVAQKRPRLAANIMLRLYQQGVPCHWLVVGGGHESSWLRRFAQRHGLGKRIHMLGNLSPQRVQEALAASDILLLPSAYEGIALVLYEALAVGAVPVAADVGGQRELVTPDCGILIARAADEEQELEAYIMAIRGLLGDPGRQHTMSQAGRTRIRERFTETHMLTHLQQVFDAAASKAHTMQRPAIAAGIGQATATLAIEHYQLEQRLRAFAPVQIALRLRNSSLAAPLAYMKYVQALVAHTDRLAYALRRTLMRWVRQVVGR